MERTGKWVFSQEIPTDVVVEVGEAKFSLHKVVLGAKSDYIRKLIAESNEPDLTRICLSGIPGGPEVFEKAAKFCYGVNFEITVHNVAALRCAAEYLQMTDTCCANNLAARTEDFLSQVALTTLSGAVAVLKPCHHLLPTADDLNIVQRCVDVITTEACEEANNPSRSPTKWWTEELSILDVEFFGKIVAGMKDRGAKVLTIASALISYAERNLISGRKSSLDESELRTLEAIVSLLPEEKAAFPINFLCCLLRSAIHLKAPAACKAELENRVSVILEHATVYDLLVLSLACGCERLVDLDSVRKVVSGFVEKEKSVAVFSAEDFGETCSAAMHGVANTVDAYLAEIAAYAGLAISTFNGIASAVPKPARKVDDDLYGAIDIYLRAHPNLDDIEREKVCSVMDPLKLSDEARAHASQNKRLPMQIVLHALYHDQLKLRRDADLPGATWSQLQTDATLARENEALRAELLNMKLFINDIQRGGSVRAGVGNALVLGTTSSSSPKGLTRMRPAFFSSVSKTLGKLNPFKHGSKDTSYIEDVVDATKPRRRRFSIS